MPNYSQEEKKAEKKLLQSKLNIIVIRKKSYLGNVGSWQNSKFLPSNDGHLDMLK